MSSAPTVSKKMSPKTWIEKYRPKTMDEVAMDPLVRRQVDSFELLTLPHLILSGLPGTGKTSTALLIAKKLLTNQDAYMELNASDNRGISMITSLTTNFIRKQFEDPRKIIILDEADNITKKAQEQLINVMECYPNVRFILTCNDMGNIIEGVQSRCMLFSFKRLGTEELCLKLRSILLCENATVESDDVLRTIIRMSDHDIRCCLNYLQSLVEISPCRHLTVKDTTDTLRVPSLQSIHCWMCGAVTDNSAVCCAETEGATENSAETEGATENGATQNGPTESKPTFDRFIGVYFELIQSGFGNNDVLNMIVCYFENQLSHCPTNYDVVSPPRSRFDRDTILRVLRATHDAHFKMIQTTDGDELLMIRCVHSIYEILR